MSTAYLVGLLFWPICCIVTFLVTVPIARRIQETNPDYDPRLIVLGTLTGVMVAFGWRLFGRA